MRIAQSALLNAAGLGLPLVAAVVCIPVLIETLGPSRFGVLTLIWAVSSYFGVFDLGLGRALTQQLAAVIELRQWHRVPPLIGTSATAVSNLSDPCATVLFCNTP